VIDAKEIFRNTVVNYFLDGYARAETPNPCLVCNRHIRWEFLFNNAKAMGADYMATGHYARRRVTGAGKVELLRAIDPTKDQSYVLHVLTQEKLSQALFPVGDYSKTEIRAIAEKLRLSVAKRPDSQDLCFLAGDDYRNFLQRNALEILKPGEIVTRDGKVLGQHSGLANYTIGQRKGLGVASPIPLYVLEKDTATNRLIIGTMEELGSQELLAVNVNWTCGQIPAELFHAMVKSRYTARETPGIVTPHENGTKVTVRFEASQRDITPGQAAVFYNGDVVIGGGIIVQSR
jgi:tRNA-specific 2-thiouridylase